MLKELQTMSYFETYYYAKVIDGVLKDPVNYLRTLNDWHEDRESHLLVAPFHKWSLLHDFSEFTVRLLAYEQIDEKALDAVAVKGRDLWVDHAMRHHGKKIPGFRAWLKSEQIGLESVTEDHANDYYHEMTESGELADLFEHLAEETFFLLFANRSLLVNLNQYASGALSHVDLNPEDEIHRQYLASDGVLKRVSIPEWVRRAVFFRDRGRCVACNCDLTGLVSLQSDDHFDHMIPLAQNGLNDVTNIQLLCAACNLKKGHKLAGTSGIPNRRTRTLQSRRLMNCCARAPNKSLQRSGTHKVLGRGRPSAENAPERWRARVLRGRRAAAELSRWAT